jgi:hypothetical protein
MPGDNIRKPSKPKLLKCLDKPILKNKLTDYEKFYIDTVVEQPLNRGFFLFLYKKGCKSS